MSRFGRRDFFRTGLAAAAALAPARALALLKTLGERAVEAGRPRPRRDPLSLDATGASPPVVSGHLRLGATRGAAGHELTVDSRSLRLDGEPWMPVMGEIHYARYPETEWREALLRMKAGGIDIVSAYVFWIHHEEVEGAFDWTERRSLRRFVELCHEVGCLAVVRCGPWCHGEVRNGGLPDWLLGKGFHLRTDDPGYLARVRLLYGEIAAQVRGLLWKDGGPVVGIQCENEYGGPAEHLLTLKRIAREVGLDVPLYTRTGWPELRTPLPAGELLPLFGAYAEGFWDRELTPMPAKYGDGFLFKLTRGDSSIAFEGSRPSASDDDGNYPYFCCEIGGGMERSYHRRIRVEPKDVEAVGLVKLGSGNNLQGYYMFQGGTNPDGRLSTLQESQATGYWNDVPVKSYDFQAPLGEFGQLRSHYHLLRRAHLFLRDHGATLATLPARLPEIRPASAGDATTLRWAARSDGRRGFVFVSNYQRLQSMPAKEGVQFRLVLEGGALQLPAEPFTVPPNAMFLWPFNLTLAGTRLIYATAQPVCLLEDGPTTYAVFAETPGVPAELVFDGGSAAIEETAGRVTPGRQSLRVTRLPVGTGAALRVRSGSGRRLCVLLLDETLSLACWKGTLLGRDRLFLTRAGLVLDGDRMRLRSTDRADLSVSILPAPARLVHDGEALAGAADGLFKRFSAPAPRASPVVAHLEPLRAAGAPRAIAKGSQGVAEAPSDADFGEAAVWRIRLPAQVEDRRQLLLRIRYLGDVARLCLGEQILTDNFYNGTPFEIGLWRHAPDVYRKELLLKILPLRKAAPIYLPQDAWPDFGTSEAVAAVTAIEVVESHQVQLAAG